jgi:hypothetical protein
LGYGVTGGFYGANGLLCLLYLSRHTFGSFANPGFSRVRRCLILDDTGEFQQLGIHLLERFHHYNVGHIVLLQQP